jgi:hypothetical protein
MTAGAAILAGDSAAALPILERWVEDFNRALESRSEAALAALFLDDSYWRDFIVRGTSRPSAEPAVLPRHCSL